MTDIVVGVVGGISVVAVLLGWAVRDGVRLRAAVAAFFGDLAAGRYGQAYELLSPAVCDRYPAERFMAEVSARKPVGYKLTGQLRVNRSPRGSTGMVGVRASFADGTTEAFLVPLRLHGAAWRICQWPCWVCEVIANPGESR
jgi:hypothetical protein